MAALPFYADGIDLEELLTWLSREAEVAFLMSDGVGRWVTRDRVDFLPRPRTGLWHVPSGPLPLFPADRADEAGEVEDPWSGWNELRTGVNPDVPYFGAGHPGVVWLNAKVVSQRDPAALGMSSFEWIGNHYRRIGRAADPQTEKWWRRLQREIKKRARRIPRSGPVDGPHPEVWALPGALAAIEAGAGRDGNP